MMKVECPGCLQPFEVQAVDQLLKEQTLWLVISYQGKLLQAKTVWKTISEFEKLMKYAGEDLGAKVRTYIRSIVNTEGELKIEFVVMADGPNVIPAVTEMFTELDKRIHPKHEESVSTENL